MAKRKRKKYKSKIKKNKNRSYLFISLGLFFLLAVGLVALLKKNQIMYYYTMYFTEKQAPKLTNSPFETQRINKIVESYSDKTFGLDISHYQEREHINWEKLTILNGAIPLEFIVLRATMGSDGKDKHFTHYWEKAKKHGLTRGAYHFYRPDEDPVTQADSYIRSVTLSSGDMRPVLDVEKLPKTKSKEQFIKDLHIWIDIIEKHYGKKPILYTYYHFYKDYLKGQFGECPLWMANYNDVPQPSDTDPWKIWQFTENGISDGIETKIDLNVYNGNKWEMRELLID